MAKQYGYIFEEKLEDENYAFINFSLYYAAYSKNIVKLMDSFKADLNKFFENKKDKEFNLIIIRRYEFDTCTIEDKKLKGDSAVTKAWNGMQGEIEELLPKYKNILGDGIFELYYEKYPRTYSDKYVLKRKCVKAAISGNDVAWVESNEGIEEKYNNILRDKCNHLIQQYAVRKSSVKEPILLESANIYANEYIFVKDLFLHPNILNLFLFEFYQKIRKYVKEKLNNQLNDIVLISTSMTGSMLVSALLRYFYIFDGKECGITNQFLLHFGPLFNVERKGLTVNELNKKKNYIYIYDFMCEGTEWRFLKNHLQAHDIDLKMSFGIALYDRPYHDSKDNENYGDEKITALVNVHDWENDQAGKYEYRISYEKNQL